jgi:hypothetical protein
MSDFGIQILCVAYCLGTVNECSQRCVFLLWMMVWLGMEVEVCVGGFSVYWIPHEQSGVLVTQTSSNNSHLFVSIYIANIMFVYMFRNLCSFSIPSSQITNVSSEYLYRKMVFWGPCSVCAVQIFHETIGHSRYQGRPHRYDILLVVEFPITEKICGR